MAACAEAVDCIAADCLAILQVRTGTRCGKTSSVEVDLRNDSDQQLRGYVIFTRADGKKQYEPTGLMKPGQVTKGAQYICDGDGSGNVGKVANTCVQPSYPPRP
jgi:hypothetical protein